MRIRNTVQEACPVCGKEITLASTEPHPTHPEIELRTYRCEDCGPVKTTSARRLPRAA
jgi:C4-type Zn-finger protein